MKGLKTTKRLLAAVLSLVMVLGMLPVIPMTIYADDGETTELNYVSLPITIRDYASDGMLFECNELGKYSMETYGGGTANSTVSTPAIYGVNPSSWSGNSYLGIRVTEYGYTKWANASRDWHCIICNASGDIVKVIPSGTLKGSATSGTYYSNMKSGYYAIWCFSGDSTNYGKISFITESNKSQYAITYTSSKITITQKVTLDGYNLGNTLGYGLLATNGNSWLNNLTTSDGIPGTTLIQNGTWNGTTEPTVMQQTLTSGVVQTLYGAYIRTDLVADELAYDANGKPLLVYTEATVNYLANYMAQTLAQPVKTDGYYNMWYVMGYEHESLGGKDLATVLREKVTGGLGTYAETAAKAEALLSSDALNNITTYTDAAYFLLHNLYNDQTGYGQSVNQYSTLNLVQKTANGKTYYTFSSAYDDVVYDTANGVIYNSQTSTITQRQNYTCNTYNCTCTTGSDWWVRGNIQPVNSFNPVGNYGYGYAGSRDTYREYCDMYMQCIDNTSQNEYYDEVNFHYTLEGHAKFIYHAEDELYFIFTGDDDVYLYINGVRVLDAGGAHAISRVEVDLNTVAEVCGLEEGEAYDFDFYYMERHGSSANFGIETNIKIVDPAMVTTKKAYQDGVAVGYNGYVNADKAVTYEFGLTNHGETHIQNITFTDSDIGVAISPDSISLNSETKLSDLRITHYNADGSVKAEYTNLTEAELKAILAAGLAVEEKLEVYGFQYTIPVSKWVDDSFINRVETTAEAHYDNASTEKLSGVADWMVQKRDLVFKSLHGYDWGKLDNGVFINGTSNGITWDLAELLDVIETENAIVLKNATVEICSPSGATTGAAVSKNATLNANGGIDYKATTTGADTFYYNIVNGDGQKYGPVTVAVYTYGVDDDIFVLDYNLPVVLAESIDGFYTDDVTYLSSNPFTTDTTGVFGEPTKNYGTFSTDGEVVYTMTKFMSGIETIDITITVLEDGATEVSRDTGVKMTQQVIVAPANVMYYEDDFTGTGAITYINTGSDENGNIWAVYEGEKNEYQSADQDMNYGYDDLAYNFYGSDALAFNRLEGSTDADKAKVQAALDAIFHGSVADWNADLYGYEYPQGTLYGDASNDVLHVLNVKNTGNAEIFNFEFVGTGFEILSRTTVDYGVLTVKIEKLVDGTWELEKAIPVISESEQGDLTQIPLVVRKNMDYGQYRVTVYTSNVRGVDRVVYLDGVRIYQPLTDDLEELYYKADEKNVTFTEIKDSIYNGDIIYGTMSPKEITDDEFGECFQQWIYGHTMIENYYNDTYTGDFYLVHPKMDEEDTKQEFLFYGPNNEIYLNSSDGGSLNYIAFYVTEDESYTGERSIQVGAHYKYSGEFDTNVDPYSVSLIYGGSAENFYSGGKYFYSVTNTTEQYYTIDVSCLEFETNPNGGAKRALVIIGTDNPNEILALTNIKLNGYSITSGTAKELEPIVDEYLLGTSILATECYKLQQYLATPATYTED